MPLRERYGDHVRVARQVQDPLCDSHVALPRDDVVLDGAKGATPRDRLVEVGDVPLVAGYPGQLLSSTEKYRSNHASESAKGGSTRLPTIPKGPAVAPPRPLPRSGRSSASFGRSRPCRTSPGGGEVRRRRQQRPAPTGLDVGHVSASGPRVPRRRPERPGQSAGGWRSRSRRRRPRCTFPLEDRLVIPGGRTVHRGTTVWPRHTHRRRHRSFPGPSRHAPLRP